MGNDGKLTSNEGGQTTKVADGWVLHQGRAKLVVVTKSLKEVCDSMRRMAKQDPNHEPVTILYQRQTLVSAI